MAHFVLMIYLVYLLKMLDLSWSFHSYVSLPEGNDHGNKSSMGYIYIYVIYRIISYSMWYSHIFPICLMIYRFFMGTFQVALRGFFWGFGICFSGSWCVRPSPTAPSFCRVAAWFPGVKPWCQGWRVCVGNWKWLEDVEICSNMWKKPWRNHEETMTLGINEDLGFLKSVCFAVLSELARYSTLLPAQVSAVLPSGKCGEKWPEGLGN